MRFRLHSKKEGVALLIVLTSMAMLAIFVGEITYTAQINQKLAYDKLDQVKAHALAKSGLKMAILRIKAYLELKKTIQTATNNAAGSGADSANVSAAVNQAIPRAMLERVWSEPLTIPFSGDVSNLPAAIQAPLLSFRKESGMEGRLYMKIEGQGSKFNLNSTNAYYSIQTKASPTPSPAPAAPSASSSGGSGSTAAQPTPTPAAFAIDQARALLQAQLEQTLQQKFESDSRFRDQYRSFRTQDLADEILGWSDLTFNSMRAQSSQIPFKRAPFYHLSELRYLPSMDDELYELFAPTFIASAQSYINVNTIKEPVLQTLLPMLTPEERKLFFETRDGGGPRSLPPAPFQDAAGFYKFLTEQTQHFKSSATYLADFQNQLATRGIQIVVDEVQFLVRIEATVNQTKKTLEAMITYDDSLSPSRNAQPGSNPNSDGGNNPSINPNLPTSNPATLNNLTPRSNLKITLLRFL